MVDGKNTTGLAKNTATGSSWLHWAQRVWQWKATLLVFVTSLTLGYAGLFEIFSENFAKPIEFRLRSALGKDPTLDPRIAIFGFDDVTVSKLGRQSLNFGEWQEILAHLSRQKPQIVVIDQVFQIIEPNTEVQELVDLKDDLPPLVAAVFSSVRNISGRSTIAHRPKQSTEQMLLPWLPSPHPFVYGPDPKIRPIFSDFGAINYSQNGMLPVAAQPNTETVFPTLGLTLADTVRAGPNGLEVNGSVVPVSKKGEIQANQAPIATYFPRIRTIASLLEDARNNRPVPGVDSNSRVFILPMMYTGNADFKSTPLGELPGGLLHVAVGNSVLTNQWISFWGQNLWVPAIAALVAALLAHWLTPFRSAALILLKISAIVALGLWAFVSESMVTPWAESCATSLFVGLTAIAEKSRLVERKTLQVRHTRAGLVPPKLFGVLLREPSRLLGHSRRVQVTVMFIDIEGFSLRMQDEDPTKVFDHLKRELGRLCEIVQRYGGIVDKTLGDGLLCYFGYNFDPEFSLAEREHAFAAMSCALDIQIDSAKRAANNSSNASGQKTLAFPLRVGINTGEVFIGNVGNHERIDLTIVGPAVNWAKRYEDVCESFRIMIGPRTKEIMTKTQGDDNIVIRMGDRSYTLYHRDIIVKHYEQRLSAWECNPFERSGNLLSDALHAVSVSESDHATGQWLTALDIQIEGQGSCSLSRFSESGATVLSSDYLPKRGTLELTLKLNGLPQGVQGSFSSLHLRATVLWGIQEGQQSRHGLRFVDVSPETRVQLKELLRIARTPDALRKTS